MKRGQWILLIVAGLYFFSAQAATCDVEANKKELKVRVEKDQAARALVMADLEDKVARDRALAIDADNTAWAKKALARCGWPLRSQYGAEDAEKFWLLVQHADMDPAFQVQAAAQLKKAVLAGEAKPWSLASLVDRNRMLQDQPQVYGLQFRQNEKLGRIEFIPIEAPEALDARRKEIGLPPFVCWIGKIAATNVDLPLTWPVGVPYRHANCEPPATQSR